VDVGGELPAACSSWRLEEVVSSWRPWFRRARLLGAVSGGAALRFVVDVRAAVPAGDVERVAVVDVDAEVAVEEDLLFFFRLVGEVVVIVVVLPPSTGPSSWASSLIVVAVLKLERFIFW
jgi:hypothetical protein